ncbi:DUF4145 domain-containing protein [Pseudomonas chlororaphis]|uniref:DUF4145 domain-containing protein n=1 Tax=Pseudomonas chlororaphis TaxID=587753 RepID=A0A1Q8EPW4_9PSED|nr:DUF4145 domain-containing protein [Pseudomonas chlororaphis]OLF53809.1 hypothetical protein BTN82_15185 [Pseudomonas chlororaphis]
MSKYVHPTFGEKAFTCVFCGVLTTMSWYPLRTFWGMSRGYGSTEFHQCYCDHCQEFSLWMGNGETKEGVMILPSSVNAPMPHADLPDECKKDFNEAREISGQSPRGSAALLRLALQKLCLHLGGEGKNINDDIKLLVQRGLAPQVQQALDLVRVTGNQAVHPGEMSLEDSPEHVTIMFEMINLIVEELIARPKQIAERFNSLPAGALAAIAKRDEAKTS